MMKTHRFRRGTTALQANGVHTPNQKGPGRPTVTFRELVGSSSILQAPSRTSLHKTLHDVTHPKRGNFTPQVPPPHPTLNSHEGCEKPHENLILSPRRRGLIHQPFRSDLCMPKNGVPRRQQKKKSRTSTSLHVFGSEREPH